jgi:signal transduction histidine kinase
MFALFGLFHAWRRLLVASRERTALGEHLAERERIAGELHDNLLQSVQGLLFGVEAIVYELPDRELVQRHLKESVAQARTIVAEARDKVRDFRSSNQLGVLADVLAKSALDVQVTVTGRPRRIDVAAFNAIKWIVGEALFTIESHTIAGHVAIELRFGLRSLALHITDDGEGLARALATSDGRDEHAGLRAVRERARKIGASLVIEDVPGAGTSIRIVVPKGRAYAHQSFFSGTM